MLKNKIIVFLIYTLPFFFIINPWYRYGLFALGVFLGLTLLILDQTRLFKFYNDDAQSAVNLETAYKKPSTNQEAVFLATRSTLFLLVLIPLSLFVVTSTGNALGGGLMMGVLLGLIQEFWQYRQLPKAFKERFLSQLKVEPRPRDINWIVYGASLYFALLNCLVIF